MNEPSSKGNKNAGLNSNRREIYRYSMEGLFIDEFKSIAEASRETEVSSSAIVNCAKGKTRFAGGYIWNYEKVSKVEKVNIKESVVKQGNVLESRNHGDFLVVREVGVRDKEKIYQIKFLKTGYTAEVSATNARLGRVKDYYFPSVSGVGFLGDNGSGIRKDEYGNKVYSIWSDMLKRCYNENRASYKYYGGLGVFVCKRWHNFSNFLEDITKIEGYNREKFENGVICLDKDLKQKKKEKNKMFYSLETCTFISSSENSILAREPDMIRFKVLYGDGRVLYSKNIQYFARSLGVSGETVREALNRYGFFEYKDLKIVLISKGEYM